MTKIKIIEQDIFCSNCNLILHQVNCQGVMGSGIAKQIKSEISNESFMVYKNYALEHKKNALGMVLLSPRLNHINQKFVNCFAQEFYGRDGKCYTDYSALETCFKKINDYANKRNLSVAIPYGIGCGLAGGDWNYVYQMICNIFSEDNCYIYHKPN